MNGKYKKKPMPKESISKENLSKIDTIMKDYVARWSDSCDFVFENYIVFYEHGDELCRTITGTYERANAKALQEHGRFFRVWQENDNVKYCKCYVRNDENVVTG